MFQASLMTRAGKNSFFFNFLTLTTRSYRRIMNRSIYKYWPHCASQELPFPLFPSLLLCCYFFEVTFWTQYDRAFKQLWRILLICFSRNLFGVHFIASAKYTYGKVQITIMVRFSGETVLEKTDTKLLFFVSFLEGQEKDFMTARP